MKYQNDASIIKELFQDDEILNHMASAVHVLNATWWHDLTTGERLQRNKGELIALMHSELSEMLEGERKSLMDDHLPHRRSAEVEAADLLIRLFDYCGAYDYDLSGAVAEKLVYNKQRADHKPENRLAPGGKVF
jgi:hypothetical protein